MTIRKIVAIIIALMLSVTLCACSTQEESKIPSTSTSKSKSFIVVAESRVGSYIDQTIMYDPDTMIMYTYLDGVETGSFSVLYQPDKSFKLYSPNMEVKTFVVVSEESVGSYATQVILYDPNNMVMYTYLDGTSAGDMSLIYNDASGTLKLYTPEG